MNILMRKKKLEKLDEYRKNNERIEVVVIIEDYEKTGLNVNQIASMLVEIMGGVDFVGPVNPKGYPYFPSVTRTTVVGDILTISVAVTGNKDEIHRLRNKFMNLMDCCKHWRKKEA